MSQNIKGRWSVSDKEIAKDSNGTIILEGSYGSQPARKAAVKRVGTDSSDDHVVSEEYKIYVEADTHINIVRCYGMECDQGFAYLFLELCTCSLADLIRIYSPNFPQNVYLASEKERLISVKKIVGNRVTLWKENGYSSSLLIKLMRDVVRGVAYLHKNKIVHRNLNSRNILIAEKKPLCAKLSNMAMSKNFGDNSSSTSHHATNSEKHYFKREAAKDLYDLGSVISFCIKGGGHLLDYPPEAEDLICQLMNPSTNLRPKAIDVYCHPFFWDSHTKLSFLRDTSDMIEGIHRGTKGGTKKTKEAIDFSKRLKTIKCQVMEERWDTKMDSALINFIENQTGRRLRHYNYNNFLDLLRLVRNNLSHYQELSKEIQVLLGTIPEGYYDYFEKRFPKLLIEVYKVVCKFYKDEERFQKYFSANLVE